jgi:GntR family negative regulator for fad regulon and positive regulator of fabA
MDWQPLPKPAEIAESRLLEAILTGHFPVNSSLPGERDLAEQLGVTRPTLREALQRLGRDGWIDIQHGKPTRVRDYWREGSLGVLAGLAAAPQFQPPDFIQHLLEIRALLAPAYTFEAIQTAGRDIDLHLEGYATLPDDPRTFTSADWELHHLLTQVAENPIHRLLLNSFKSLYALMGERYFAYSDCRQHSRAFYASLRNCGRRKDGRAAEVLTRRIMQESITLWQGVRG